MRQKTIDGILVTKPTRQDVQDLKVGDRAPNCFGRMARVVEITAQRDNVHGRAFVCYYTETGSSGRISGAMTEDEIVSTIPVTSRWGQRELVPWETH